MTTGSSPSFGLLAGPWLRLRSADGEVSLLRCRIAADEKCKGEAHHIAAHRGTNCMAENPHSPRIKSAIAAAKNRAASPPVTTR